jgi:hypothetical protein
MQAKSLRNVRCLPLLLFLLPMVACNASGPKNTHVHSQRPFISRDTHTTAENVVALEAGTAIVAGHEQEIPIRVKYGLGQRSEFFLETSPYKSVDLGGSQTGGWGDTYVGMRHRMRDSDMYSPAYGFQMQTKIPTGRAGNGLGTGETDWFGALMATQTYYGFETTLFYQLGIVGEPDSSNSDLQHTVAVQTRLEFGPSTTGFAEFAFVSNPDEKETETTLMGGISLGVDSLTAIDLAVRVGLGDDAQDFQVLIGISRALGMLFFPEDQAQGSPRR